jgi:hypothetical protein
MQERLYHLEFGVANLNEVRTVVNVWEEMMADIFDQMKFEFRRAVTLSYYSEVRVTIEDEPPHREVFLNFFAPKAMVEWFLKTLRDQGLRFTREVNKEESVIRCRLTPPDAKP